MQVMQRKGDHATQGQRPSSGLCPLRTGNEIRKPPVFFHSRWTQVLGYCHLDLSWSL